MYTCCLFCGVAVKKPLGVDARFGGSPPCADISREHLPFGATVGLSGVGTGDLSGASDLSLASELSRAGEGSGML